MRTPDLTVPSIQTASPGPAEMVSPGPSTNRFFADIAHTWVSRYATRASFQERLRSVAQVVGPILARSEQPAVLDFGGGPGIFSLLCSGRAGFVVNLDPSQEMIMAGRWNQQAMAAVVERTAPISFGRIRYVVGSLDVLCPAGDNRFDLILAIAVLEYLDDPREAVDRLGRMLRPGGSLLITVPRDGSGFRRAERLLEPIAGWWRTERAPRRVRERSYRTLRPHRDSVPWRSTGGPGGLSFDLRRPLALSDRGIRAHITPNDIVVLRRPSEP